MYEAVKAGRSLVTLAGMVVFTLAWKGAVMIWESWPWRMGLLKDADILDRWSIKTNSGSRRELLFEKKIFLTAYVIRKLFEAKKVCTIVPDIKIKCASFPRTNTDMTPWNFHRIEEHFDFDLESTAHLSATALVNQIIHSHVFMLVFNEEDHVVGFTVSSIQGKKKTLFSVHLANYLFLIREVGNDQPTTIHSKINPTNGEYLTVKMCPIHGMPKPLTDEL